MNIKRRQFLKFIGYSAAVVCTGCTGVKKRTAGSGKRPNVVLVVSDDQRQDMLSCMGNEYVNTPNFDRLADEGMVFENAFCTSGVCSPSRSSFLTGKHPHQAGSPMIIWTNHTFLNNEKTIAWYLNQQGYQTGHVGKWHLGKGDMPKPGYDYWAGFKFLGHINDPVITINGKPERFKGFCDDVIANIAAGYIKNASKGEAPFFLFVGLKSPHLPFAYPPRYENLLENVKIPKPDTYHEDYSETGKPAFMEDNLIRIEEFKGGGIPYFGSWDKYIKSYYRSSQALDDAMGVILDELDQAGVSDETLVIYSSDQGYTLGEHGNTEKHYAYEEVIRIPMLVRWPQVVKPAVRRKELALNIDVMPTILDAAGVALPGDVSGKSWMPLLANPKANVSSWRDAFLFKQESPGSAIPGQIAVRTQRYKLITYQSFPDMELYDLKKDPGEVHNLVNNPDYINVLKSMQKKLEALKKKHDLRPYIDYPLKSIYLMKIPDKIPQAKVDAYISKLADFETSFIYENNYYKWRNFNTPTPGEFILPEELIDSEHLLAGYNIHVQGKKDPYTTLHGPACEAVGYANGEKIWSTEIKVLNPFNPPLRPGKNIIVLEIKPPKNGKIILKINAPENTINLQ